MTGIDSPSAPDTNSAAIMNHVDSLSRPMRALVREFGYKIVADMIDDGYRNARELKPLLQTWRERRQEDWLAMSYIVPRSVESIADAVMNRMNKNDEKTIWDSARA